MSTVLVVDDTPDVNQAMVMIFRRAGHEVLSADHPAAAVHVARRHRPDLVLLNLTGDGALQVCRTLRANPGTAEAAIIVLSADLHPNDDDAAAAGADAYVSKPFTNAELLARAESVLTGRTPTHPDAPDRGRCPA